jgi:hypothetical protein
VKSLTHLKGGGGSCESLGTSGVIFTVVSLSAVKNML